MDVNASGFYPGAQSSAVPQAFGPVDDETLVGQRKKPGPMVRRPLGDVSAQEPSTAPVKVEGQQPEQTSDVTESSGSLPTTPKATQGGRGAPADFPGVVLPNPDGLMPQADTDPPPATRLSQGAALMLPRSGGKPEMNISNPPMNQMEPAGMQTVSASGPAAPTQFGPSDTQAPAPNPAPPAPVGGIAAKPGIQPNQPQAGPSQDPAQADKSPALQQATADASKLSSFGPEPTWNTLPDEQKHHGWRKALDYIAAIGTGVGTLNPTAGMGMYNMTSRAPLRNAQDTWRAKTAAASGSYKRDIEQAKQGTAEEGVQAKEASYENRETILQKQLGELKNKNELYGKKIVNRWQDSNGNWKGEQADGTIVDTSPVQTAGEKTAEQHKEWVAEADREGLTGEDRKFFIANGKLREPGTNIHVPSESSELLHDWKAAFRAEHGRDPNSQELNDYRRGAGNRPPHAKDRQTFEDHWGRRFQQGEQTKERARQEVLKSYGSDRDASKYADGDNKAAIDAKFAEIEAQWSAEKAKLQNEKDAEADQYGVYNQQSGASQGQPKPAAQPQQSQPQQKSQPSQPKVATQQQLQAYAQKKGISVEQAAQEFKDYGYSVH